VNGERNGVEGSAQHDDRPVDEHERARTTIKKASQKAKKGACPRASPPCKLGLSEISSQTIIGELAAAGPAHATILSPLSLSLFLYLAAHTLCDRCISGGTAVQK